MEKKKHPLSFLLLLILGLSTSVSQAQTIQRQTVGSAGGSAEVSDVLVQFTVGQPYATYTKYTNSIGSRPGFIQPVSIVSAKAETPITFKVYPNPAQNVIHMNSDQDLTQPHISVLNLQGQEVYAVSYFDERSIEIDCSEWASGTYFVTVTDQNIPIHTSKIVKIN